METYWHLRHVGWLKSPFPLLKSSGSEYMSGVYLGFSVDIAKGFLGAALEIQVFRRHSYCMERRPSSFITAHNGIKNLPANFQKLSLALEAN
jgi:hypothetical protein